MLGACFLRMRQHYRSNAHCGMNCCSTFEKVSSAFGESCVHGFHCIVYYYALP